MEGPTGPAAAATTEEVDITDEGNSIIDSALLLPVLHPLHLQAVRDPHPLRTPDHALLRGSMRRGVRDERRVIR